MPIWGEVELLRRAVSEEGRKEAEQVLARARTDADRLVAEAREKAGKDLEGKIVARRGAAHAEAKRIVDSAELEAKRRIMVFREKIVQEVFEALRERLKEFRRDPAYVDFLARALEEGMERLEGNAFIAELNEDDLPLFQGRAEQIAAARGASLSLRPSPSVNGGVRVYSGDGRTLFDNSLSARIERRKDAIRSRIWRSHLRSEEHTSELQSH